MAVILQKDATRGTNDTNEGIYLDIVTPNLSSTSYDFDTDSSYVIDVRGRSLLGLAIEVTGSTVKYQMFSTNKEFSNLSDLVVGDFDNTIETATTQAITSAPVYDAIDITTDPDNFMATAVLIQFAANAVSGIITAVTLGDGGTAYTAGDAALTGRTSGASNASGATITVTGGVIQTIGTPSTPGSGYLTGEIADIVKTPGVDGTVTITTTSPVVATVTGIIRVLNK